MNTENEKAVINDENLDAVAGGTAPELPATELKGSKYGQYEPHFYDGKVVDPTYFITKAEDNKNE